MVTAKIPKLKKPIIEEKRARYFEAKGGRKTAVARVRLYTKKSGVIVNDKDYKEYFEFLKNI